MVYEVGNIANGRLVTVVLRQSHLFDQCLEPGL